MLRILQAQQAVVVAHAFRVWLRIELLLCRLILLFHTTPGSDDQLPVRTTGIDHVELRHRCECMSRRIESLWSASGDVGAGAQRKRPGKLQERWATFVPNTNFRAIS